MAKKANPKAAPVVDETEGFVPDPDVHIHIEGIGYEEYEGAGEKPRRISIGGVNYEHVSDTPEGIWSYRAM